MSKGFTLKLNGVSLVLCHIFGRMASTRGPGGRSVACGVGRVALAADSRSRLAPPVTAGRARRQPPVLSRARFRKGAR